MSKLKINNAITSKIGNFANLNQEIAELKNTVDIIKNYGNIETIWEGATETNVISFPINKYRYLLVESKENNEYKWFSSVYNVSHLLHETKYFGAQTIGAYKGTNIYYNYHFNATTDSGNATIQYISRNGCDYSYVYGII